MNDETDAAGGVELPTGRAQGLKAGVNPTSGRLAQAAIATICSFVLVLAHAAGVNCLITVILAAGKRVNKSFR